LDRAFLAPGHDSIIEAQPRSVGLIPSIEPTWAALCGYLSSGIGPWDASDLLRGMATWLLADAILGCIFAQLIVIGRLSLVAVGASEDDGALLFGIGLPYAVVGSPGHRLMLQVRRHLRHWRDLIWPVARDRVLAGVVGAGLALVIAAYLGREMFLLAASGLLVAVCLALFARGDQACLARWFAGLHLALAWSLGHVSEEPRFGALPGVGALFGLAAYARARLTTDNCRGAIWLLRAIWVVLVVGLLVIGQPVLAAMTATAALADSMAVSDRNDDASAVKTAHPGRFGWLFATLVTSLVIAYRD